MVACFFTLRMIVEPGVFVVAERLSGAITTGEGIGERLDFRGLLVLLVLSMNEQNP